MIYLDNSATTRQADEVTQAMVRVAEEDYGNPSSLHQAGLNAENHVTEARGIFAESLGVPSEQIYFNSGGTEGDNTVLYGVSNARKHKGNKIVTSAVEHPAVLEGCKRLTQNGLDVSYIGVDDQGHLNMEQLEEEVDDNTILVSIMAVNNEVGSVMPLSDIAYIAHRRDALFHTDAVQAYGKMDLKNTGADFITVSAHKFHGPKGVGAIYMGANNYLPPLILGGGQERGFRSGTENVPGIVGMGVACKLAEAEAEATRTGVGIDKLKAYLEAGIRDRIADIRVNSPADSCQSILNVSFLGCRGEVLLHALESDGIYVSTGSACSSHKKGQSHVLSAMGLRHKEIEGALRFSFSRYNTIDEMDQVLDSLEKSVKRFRRLGSFR